MMDHLQMRQWNIFSKKYLREVWKSKKMIRKKYCSYHVNKKKRIQLLILTVQRLGAAMSNLFLDDVGLKAMSRWQLLLDQLKKQDCKSYVEKLNNIAS